MAKVIEFKTKKEYESWLRKQGTKIKIISVNTTRRWDIWHGPLNAAMTYTVTYEKK